MRPCELRRLRGPCAVAAVCALSALAPAASADDGGSKAAALFREGAAAFARHDYRSAAADFEAADRASPHGAPLYNAGLSWEAAGEQATAADAYALALVRGGLHGRDLADTQARLAALEKALGRIDVQAAAGAEVTLDQVQRARPVRAHVTAGTHEVRVTFADGRAVTRPVDVAAGAVASIVVEPAPREVTAAPPVASGSMQRTVGFVGVGTGVVLGGVAIGTGVAALSARNAFLGSGDTDASSHDRAASLRTWTNVAWAAAAATGITGVVLVLTAPSRPPVTSYLRVGPPGVVAGGSF